MPKLTDKQEPLEMLATYSLLKFSKFLGKFNDGGIFNSPYFEGVDGGLTGDYQTDINEAYKSLLRALSLETEIQIKDLDDMETKDVSS